MERRGEQHAGQQHGATTISQYVRIPTSRTHPIILIHGDYGSSSEDSASSLPPSSGLTR